VWEEVQKKREKGPTCEKKANENGGNLKDGDNRVGPPTGGKSGYESWRGGRKMQGTGSILEDKWGEKTGYAYRQQRTPRQNF